MDGALQTPNSLYTTVAAAAQQNDIEVDENKSLEELGFVPSVVSDSPEWRDTLRVKFMCEKKFYDIGAILAEDDGLLQTINLCRPASAVGGAHAKPDSSAERGSEETRASIA